MNREKEGVIEKMREMESESDKKDDPRQIIETVKTIASIDVDIDIVDGPCYASHD